MKKAWPVSTCPIFGCWLWQGAFDRDGYPSLWIGRNRRERGHRYVWTVERGPIPPGMELDHLCRRIACVRPEHLELVTRSENERRKSWRHRVRRETCPKGHSLFLNALRTEEGGFVCRECCGLRR